MEIISNNPYRLLGIYSNSSIKERVANANKLKAYLKVGKSVSFPLDFSNLISTPVRTVESIEQANGSISLPHNQLKYALFWFIRASSIDEIALGYLQQGDTEKTKELLGKKETFSSLINLGVLALIQNDNITAIQSITKVIHNDNYRNAFVEAVCGNTYQMAEDDMAQLFMDELLTEVPAQELMQVFLDYGTVASDATCLKSKVIGKPIAIINAEIARAKAVKNNDADAQYRAGVALMNKTKESLAAIRNLLSTSDMQYQMIADNLAKQILQCGINYYNNSEEPDAAIKAMPIQKHALQIAVGALTKDRCRENVGILQEIINQLPPQEVYEESQAIRNYLEDYEHYVPTIQNAIILMQSCAPLVMEIRNKLGDRHPYLCSISTLIVQRALHFVIEEVNFTLVSVKNTTLSRLSVVLKNAWLAILNMECFFLESKFKTNRLIPQKKTLKSLLESAHVPFNNTVANIDFRTEKEIYDACKAKEHFSRYLERYPKGKYALKARKKIDELKAEEQFRVKPQPVQSTPVVNPQKTSTDEGSSLDLVFSWGFVIAFILCVILILLNA